MVADTKTQKSRLLGRGVGAVLRGGLDCLTSVLPTITIIHFHPDPKIFPIPGSS